MSKKKRKSRIQTYTKSETTYIKWQGVIDGEFVQVHCGRADEPESEIRAVKLEIQYLENKVREIQAELYLHMKRLEELQTKVKEENEVGSD